MSGLERLWAGWRAEYINQAASSPEEGDECVFCRILGSGRPDDETYVVWRGERCLAILNAFPYTSGHVLVMPTRHVGEPEDLTPDEHDELWRAVIDGVRALKVAYRPDGVNFGANLGRAAGAGMPGHFHVHALPRWSGDTNFMGTVAEVRVLSEALPFTWEKVRAAWPRATG